MHMQLVGIEPLIERPQKEGDKPKMLYEVMFRTQMNLKDLHDLASKKLQLWGAEFEINTKK